MDHGDQNVASRGATQGVADLGAEVGGGLDAEGIESFTLARCPPGAKAGHDAFTRH